MARKLATAADPCLPACLAILSHLEAQPGCRGERKFPLPSRRFCRHFLPPACVLFPCQNRETNNKTKQQLSRKGDFLNYIQEK